MHTSRKRLRLAIVLAIAWCVGSRDLAHAQQVVLYLPPDDPSPNSWVLSSVAFSPDGKLVSTTHGMPLGMLQEPKPGQTILWDARTGKRTKTIPGTRDGVRSAVFSPDGKTLAVLEYTFAIIESYENGGTLVRPHPLPTGPAQPTNFRG